MPKPKPSEARRIQFDKHQRAAGLDLATRYMEAQDAYEQWLGEQLKARGVDTETTGWRYESLTGIASRVR